MTCIVGVQHGGEVVIGGDSAGVAGYAITARADEKVFVRDGYIFGFTSSFRMGQLLRYEAELPCLDTAGRRDPDRFMVRRFIPAIREALKDGGFTNVDNNTESGGTFLVGMRGRLYSVEDDFQIGRSRDGYMAVGCGDDLALGSLHATHHLRREVHPGYRVRKALTAAAHHSAGVCGPFKVMAA